MKKSPTVITSDLANKHYLMIQDRHKNIIAGMQQQSEKLKLLTQEKMMREHEDSINKQQVMKDKMESDQKQRELDIKERALNS